MTIRIYTEQNLTPETCNGCDVAAQCLEYALRTDQRDGVWGGLSQVARTRLRKKRNTA
jgi:WhiB family redox-sensing transcriptional regulator